ncbi:uncharacterized protein LOC135332883 isoform X3 [Halichondria panicea]|uniref:uncharacterized protein LOC135332883 isoform X3 n=1 Tax=Halichondria panicea TaxID=6063 RepID=UPI00312B3EAC
MDDTALVLLDRAEDGKEEVEITKSIGTLIVHIEDTFKLERGSISHLQIWSEKFNDYKNLKKFEEVRDGCKINAVPMRKQDQPIATTHPVPPGMPLAPTLTFCTDSLGEDEDEASSDASQEGASGFALKTNIWTGKDVLFVLFLNPEILEQEKWKCEGSVLNIGNILAWAEAWNTNKCPNIPTFKKTERPERAHIRVKFAGGTCASKVGRQATTVGDVSKPTMTLSLKGLDPNMQKFLVVHEFGHALGLEHEHQRSDFWKVADSLLDVGKMRNDPQMKNVKFDKDMLENQSQDAMVTTPKYDPDSIMHYWFNVNWLMKKEHKNLSKVEADGSLSEDEKAILRGIHKRHRSCADRPSKKDLDFLQENYVSPVSASGQPPSLPAAPSYGRIQLSPSDKLYFNTLHDAAYNGRGMWHNIGIRLGLSEFDLDAIQTNNLSKVEGCYRAMLLKWFQSSPNCYLDIFLSALKSENVGLLHLYSKVEEAILKIAFPGQGNNRKRSAKRMPEDQAKGGPRVAKKPRM